MTVTTHLKNLRTAKTLGIVAGVVLFLLQVIVDSTVENLVCAVLCLMAFVSGCLFVFRLGNIRGGAAFTAGVILLSITSNSIVPMVGTLLSGHSLVYRLEQPVTVFSHRLIFAWIMIAVHLTCVSGLLKPAHDLMGRGFDVIKVRELVQPRTLWIMGGTGILLLLLRWFVIPPGSVIAKIFEGFNFLSTAPFVLLVPPYLNQTKRKPLWILGLMGIFVFNAVLGITSRMAFIAPLAVVGSAMLVTFIAGKVSLPAVIRKRYFILGALGFFAMMQLQDISKAIIVERAHRGERTWEENLKHTVETFQDKKKLKDHDESIAAQTEHLEATYGKIWSEDYIDQPFLARFTAIKFDDNIFGLIRSYSKWDIDTVKSVTRDKITAQLPSPLLKVLGLKVDKDWIISFSMGDIMYVCGNSFGRLGSLKTGSLLGHSFMTFGWYYPLVLYGLLTPLFLIFQTLSTPRGKTGRGIGISAFGLIFCFTFYLGFSLEGYNVIVNNLIRGVWQMLFLYAILMFGIRLISPAATRERPSRLRRANDPIKQPARATSLQ